MAVLVENEKVDREDPASFSFSFMLPETLTPTFRVSRQTDWICDRALARSCQAQNATQISTAQRSSGQHSAAPFSLAQRSVAQHSSAELSAAHVRAAQNSSAPQRSTAEAQ